jgi:hypothetical protein
MNNTAIKARATRRLRICAIVCLGLLGLSTISEFNQQYLEHAIVSSIMLLIAVGIYLLKRYWWAILLVAITLVGNRFLNW